MLAYSRRKRGRRGEKNTELLERGKTQMDYIAAPADRKGKKERKNIASSPRWGKREGSASERSPTPICRKRKKGNNTVGGGIRKRNLRVGDTLFGGKAEEKGDREGEKSLGRSCCLREEPSFLFVRQKKGRKRPRKGEKDRRRRP